jgi:hypothetical protein
MATPTLKRRILLKFFWGAFTIEVYYHMPRGKVKLYLSGLLAEGRLTRRFFSARRPPAFLDWGGFCGKIIFPFNPFMDFASPGAMFVLNEGPGFESGLINCPHKEMNP